LCASQSGATVQKLGERAGCSRATVYRYLDLLEEAGVPISCEKRNGEARYRLLSKSGLPELGLTSLQVAALHFARRELEPIAGSELVAELDALLAKLRPVERQQTFRFAARPTGRPDALKVIDRALRSKRRLRIEYRAASRRGVPAAALVEPLMLSVADGDAYLRAYSLERGAERTYKIARVSRVELINEPVSYRPERPLEEAFVHSVKAWSGEPTMVRIRLDREVAWLAREYPLVEGQKLEEGRDGAVVIEATVSGIVEAARWVLSWGGAAEALHPPALRALLSRELAKGLAKYGRPGTAKAHEKSTRRPTRRLTDLATRGA
jgi:predicted DNA-binding transcriptional regulator YafY